MDTSPLTPGLLAVFVMVGAVLVILLCLLAWDRFVSPQRMLDDEPDEPDDRPAIDELDEWPELLRAIPEPALDAPEAS